MRHRQLHYVLQLCIFQIAAAVTHDDKRARVALCVHALAPPDQFQVVTNGNLIFGMNLTRKDATGCLRNKFLKIQGLSLTVRPGEGAEIA
ncbi:TPA: hypothetical protein ODO01_002364 [Escherichia coli]|nr:hypothetical protein [Escherichia coli]